MSAPPFDRLTPSLRAFAAGIALLWAGAALAETSIEDQVTTATLSALATLLAVHPAISGGPPRDSSLSSLPACLLA